MRPQPPSRSYLTRLRGVELLPGEAVQAILHAERGLLAEPAAEGRLLVATTRRLISDDPGPRAHATQMFPAASVCGVSVRHEARRSFSWPQWTALIFGAAALYLLLAYWLVDRLPGIIIPVINLHAAALLLMLLILLAAGLIWRSMSQPGGRQLQIAGVNWNLDLPCAAPESDLLAFANALLTAADATPAPPVAAYANADTDADADTAPAWPGAPPAPADAAIMRMRS